MASRKFVQAEPVFDWELTMSDEEMIEASQVTYNHIKEDSEISDDVMLQASQAIEASEAIPDPDVDDFTQRTQPISTSMKQD
jgi:hypothetical protein